MLHRRNLSGSSGWRVWMAWTMRTVGLTTGRIDSATVWAIDSAQEAGMVAGWG